ncbi:MAG: alpha/beta hydrolase fold domain-containing protein [Caldilineaceae bacterium]
MIFWTSIKGCVSQSRPRINFQSAITRAAHESIYLNLSEMIPEVTRRNTKTEKDTNEDAKSTQQTIYFCIEESSSVERQEKRTTNVDWNKSHCPVNEDVENAQFLRGYRRISRSSVEADGVTGEWLRPTAYPGQGILYFHGGGLVIGSAKSHRGIVSKFVNGSGIAALVFDYQLGPGTSVPGGVERFVDHVSAPVGLGIAAEDIVFMGDSGSGNLVFTTMLALKDGGCPCLPQVAMSPWTDQI